MTAVAGDPVVPPDGRWPLVGREAFISDAVAAVTRRAAGLVITGEAGVGKTKVAAAIADRFGAAGWLTYRGIATPSGQRVPLSVLSPLLGRAEPAGTGVADLLVAVERSLLAEAGGRGVLIAIDDANWMDDLSVALLQHLAGQARMATLLTVRTDAVHSDPVTSLRHACDLPRRDLPALSRNDVGLLLQTALGGPVDGLTFTMLWRTTRGNPLFLREVLRGATASGALVRRGTVWAWNGDAVVHAGLWDAVATTLGTLGADDTKAIEYLAYAEPVPMRILQSIVDHVVLEGLEQRGLVETAQHDGRFHVMLAHPLYGEALRARTGPIQAQRIRAGLAAAIADLGTDDDDDQLRHVSWRLDADLAVPASDLLAAAEIALARHDAPLALRLAGRVGTPAAAWLCGRALIAQGQVQQAEEQLAQAYVTLTDPLTRARAATLRALNLCWGLRNSQAAHEAVAQARSQLPEHVHHDLCIAEAVTAVFGGIGGATLDEIAPVVTLKTEDRFLHTVLALLHPYIAIFAGHPGQVASQFDERCLPIPQEWPAMRAAAHACHVYALVLTGRLRDAENIVDDHYHDALARGSRDGVAFLTLMRAVCASYRGRSSQALTWVREARALLDSQTLAPIRSLVLSMHADVAAELGLPDEAHDALAETATITPQDNSIHDYQTLAEGMLLAMGGHRQTAVSTFHQLADAAQAQGRLTAAVTALHFAARLDPRAHTVTRLRDLVSQCTSPLFALYADLADALRHKAPAQLTDLSARFEQLGYDYLALEAAVWAKTHHRDRGDGRTAARLDSAIERLRRNCEGYWPRWLPHSHHPPSLTRREREICELAAAGLNNQAIATKLVLSIRTVESHLHHAFTKLGIRHRSDLTDIINLGG